MYISLKLQSSLLLAKLLPDTYHRSYRTDSSASHYHWEQHPVMVPFPCILIPDAAMEWTWDANSMYELLLLRLIPYLILESCNSFF